MTVEDVSRKIYNYTTLRFTRDKTNGREENAIDEPTIPAWEDEKEMVAALQNYLLINCVGVWSDARMVVIEISR